MDPYDVTIVGSGPGGYMAAIRAGQLGLRTAIVERENIGGVCLNWGCIPSKALLRNAEVLSLFRHAEDFGIAYEHLSFDYSKAIDRSQQVVRRLTKGVESLLKKNKVDLHIGEAQLISPKRIEVKGTGQTIETRNIVIATGARARSLPGLKPDGDRVLTSREAIVRKEVPGHTVVVGGGAIGAEFAYIYRSYGGDVTIVELLPHLLPNEDAEISQVVEAAFAEQGIKFLTNATVEALDKKKTKLTVQVETPAGRQKLDCDQMLVAVGVQANSDGFGLEGLGIQLEKGFIKIDGKMQTSLPGVYAVGDVTGPPLLAHVASAQGIVAVESIAGRETQPLDYEQMPRATYCQPQVASIGLTEAQARERGFEMKIGRFPFRANGKALALNDYEGLVKFVIDARSGEILGAHAIGHDVTELLGELSLAHSLESTALSLGRTVHAHPTLSEALMEAALNAEGEAIHI